MCTGFSSIFIHPSFWRFVGFGSSIIGFSCFSLSPSFQTLFGHWNMSKIVLYYTVSFMFSVLMLFIKYCQHRFPRVFWVKIQVCFLVLMLTSLYSYYEDRSKRGETEGKGYKILSLISFGAFALMSMSLSTQIQPGFEAGMSNFFLGCLIVGGMKMNFKIGVGVAVVCYVVMSIRSYSDSHLELPGRRGDTQHVILEIASLFRNETQRLAHEIRNGDPESDDNAIDTVDSLLEETSAIRSPPLSIDLSSSDNILESESHAFIVRQGEDEIEITGNFGMGGIGNEEALVQNSSLSIHPSRSTLRSRSVGFNRDFPLRPCNELRFLYTTL